MENSDDFFKVFCPFLSFSAYWEAYRSVNPFSVRLQQKLRDRAFES